MIELKEFSRPCGSIVDEGSKKEDSSEPWNGPKILRSPIFHLTRHKRGHVPCIKELTRNYHFHKTPNTGLYGIARLLFVSEANWHHLPNRTSATHQQKKMNCDGSR